MHDLWILAESGDFRSQPLLSRVLSISETADQLFDPVIVIVFVLWSLYTKALPARFQGTCESGQSESLYGRFRTFLVLYICYFIYLTLFLVFYPDIS